MHRCKGASARVIFQRFPEFKMDMESNSFWQRSYGSREVPEDQISTVLRYITSQDDRPVRHFG
jgi:REP element-mobilizing transposase RayT